MSHLFRPTVPPVARVNADGLRRVPVPLPIKTRRWPIILLSVLLGITALLAGYFFYQYRFSPAIKTERELETLITDLRAIVELPTDEVPTLATVTDRSKLAGQEFFRGAADGDKVLIYPLSGRAILYRPSTKKIVDITTLATKLPTDTKEAAAEKTGPIGTAVSAPGALRVALFNGSERSGLTSVVENSLKRAFPQAVVVAKETAAKTNYQKTVIVDLTGSQSTVARSLAVTFGGEVGSLPVGEKAPLDTDLLIIVGESVVSLESER